jgi:hypothetical protein
MAPLLDAVKAESVRCGSGKPDYRNLLHNSILWFLLKKKVAVEATLMNVMGLTQPLFSPSCQIGRFSEEVKVSKNTVG